jgi:hypothetical protein
VKGHRVINLTAICEPIVWRKCGALDVSQPYGPSRPVTVIALPSKIIYMNTHIHGFDIIFLFMIFEFLAG